MLVEEPNDSFSWRSKLDELDSLPGETFSNKTEVWERLHQRLRGNRKLRKIAWYWIAAACLVLIILVPWGNNKKEPVSVKIKSDKSQSKSMVTRSLPAQKIDAGSEPVTSFVPAKTKFDKPVIEKRNNKNKPGTNIGKNDTLSAYTTAASPVTGISIINNPVPSIDSGSVAIKPANVKKKLRVVHINELGVPVEDVTQDERYVQRPPYYRLLTNQNRDLISNPSTNSHTVSNDFFKIKSPLKIK